MHCVAAGLLMAVAAPVSGAPGWTAVATPTDIELVRGQGVLIAGAFGNPGTPCTDADKIWIAATHPQYQALLSTALSAMAGGMKIHAYVHGCAAIGWHGGTYNELTADGALYISR